MAFRVTQCPGCDSTFNTNARILQLAQGKVRCGACLTVFEAAEHFVSINDTDADEDASVFVGHNPSDFINPTQFITRSALTAQEPVTSPGEALIAETEPEPEPDPDPKPEPKPDPESAPEPLATPTKEQQLMPVAAPLAPEEFRLHASFSLYYLPAAEPEPEVSALDSNLAQDSGEETTANALAEVTVEVESVSLPPLDASTANPPAIPAANALPIAEKPDAAATEIPTAETSSLFESEHSEEPLVQAEANATALQKTVAEPANETSHAIEILAESARQTDGEFPNASPPSQEFELIDLDEFYEEDVKLGDGLDWNEDGDESPLENEVRAAEEESRAAAVSPAPITKPATSVPRTATGKRAARSTEEELDDSTETIRARAFRAVLEDDDALEALPAESRKALGRALPPVELISGRESQWGKRIALFFVGVLLAAVLAAQFLWQRLPIYSRTAQWRPVYEFACQFIACELPVYSEISAIRSDNIVVRSHPTSANALSVSLSFRNTARFPQPFPVLILSFNSATNAVIALREFAPEEYLDINLRDLTMMPVMSPLQIELNVMDPGVDAVNYTVAFRRP